MKCARTVLILLLAFAFTSCVLLKTDERIDVVVAVSEPKKLA